MVLGDDRQVSVMPVVWITMIGTAVAIGALLESAVVGVLVGIAAGLLYGVVVTRYTAGR